MQSRQDSIHPGEILRGRFLVPLGLTAYRLCKETGMPQDRVSRILAGTRAITADTALRLARFFGTPPEFWMILQAKHDLRVAVDKRGKAIEKQITPWKA